MKRNCTKIVCVFLEFLAILALSSCSDKFQISDPKPPQKVEVGFYAGGTQTRTTMLSNGLSAAWEKGDRLAVWALASDGTYAFANQSFTTYGLDESRGFFTSTLDSEMAEGTYTYYCCYPKPVSVSGTSVSFNLPAVQDGKVSGGADIMIATPVRHGALTAIPDPEDHSGMSMEMNRMMHQFRFWVPEEDQLLGDEKIEQIFLSFPTPVVGDVTLDLANVETPSQLSNGQADVHLKLSQPIGRTTGADYQFACVAMNPVQFASGQTLSLKAYTDDKVAYFDPIDLKGKNCQAGHSTPVKLKIRELVDMAGMIYVTVGANNLGENPKKITLTAPEGCIWGDGASNVYVYEPGREILVGETLAFRFEADLESYMAFSNKQITVTYDSENALLQETLTMPSITSHGTSSLSLTVPYLLFEDFSCVFAEGESYGNNSYSQSEREQPGSSLDGCMSHTGWNAARYWTTGNSIRINTRYQCVGAEIFGYSVNFASYHHGRLDTPQLTGLKPGKTVNLMMNFDAGGYYHESSSGEVNDPTLCIATHTNTGVIDGIPTGSTGISSSYDTTVSDFGSRQSSCKLSNSYGNNAFSETFPTNEAYITGATSSTRLVFYIIYTGKDNSVNNSEFFAYIDNIKVQISN